MDDHLTDMERTLAIARWEISLGERDNLAERKRQQQAYTEGLVLMNKAAKGIRAERLKKLYKDDEAMYEEELVLKGLTFRKERI
jgi:Domain of unknown function (DUF4558)